MKHEKAKQFLPCEVKLVTVKDEDVISTSNGIDVGKEVGGNPYDSWGDITAQGGN